MPTKQTKRLSWQYGFKVLRSPGRLSALLPDAIALHYPVGVEVKRQPGFGAIAVFDTRENAMLFIIMNGVALGRYSTQSLTVHVCKFIKSRHRHLWIPKSVDLPRRASQRGLWLTVVRYKKYAPTISGTMFANRVICLD